MKKELFTKIILTLSVIFAGLQFAYSQIILKKGVYNQKIRYAEYVVMGLIMLTSLFYVKKENKEVFKKLLIIYIVFIILFIISLIKGVI